MDCFGYPGKVSIFVQNYLARGFWGDEAWTALISQFPIAEIVRITGEDFHPPFYYFLVHGFIQLFGASEWIRLISVIFWLATFIPIYLLGKKLVDKGFGILAGIVVLFNPILFTYAFEARAYALVSLLSVALTLVFWNFLKEESRRRWLLIYFILGVVAVYSHYYMWFILVAHGVYWLIFSRKKFLQVFLTYLGIIGAQLPWIPILFGQLSSVKGGYWIGPIGKQTHWEFLVRIAGGDFETPQRLFTVCSIIIITLVGLAGSLIKDRRLNKSYLFLWLWLIIPILLPTLISFYRPVFFYRYLIFSAIPLLLIGLWGLYRLKPTLAYGGGAFLVALYLSINIIGLGRYPYTMREELIKIANESPTKDYKLVTTLPAFAEVAFYNQGEKSLQVLPEGLLQSSGKSLLDAYVRHDKIRIEEIDDDETYWLVEPGPKSSFHLPGTSD